MFELYYKPSFYKDLEDVVEDKTVRRQIIKKTLQLEFRAPIGKKLSGYPYWSIRVGGFRIIYRIEGRRIEFLRIFPRGHDYEELRGMPRG
jgi:mRNA-degrading endonuclease RelE of RelBE toxin-antitoxin system